MEKFDLCVIGGGPAGYAAAMRAVDFGKRVCLIEKGKLGGYGIYDGALASKTMWEFAKRYSTVVNEIGSKEGRNIDVTFDEVREVINSAIFERKFQLSCHLRIINAETELITYEKGHGSFINEHEIMITKEDGATSTIWAENTVIATGSRSRALPDLEVDEETILTSDGILHLKEFPKSMVILGAGVIGCEFATMFAQFGKTQVYLIDRSDRVLPFEDDDVSATITRSLKKLGVTVHGKSSLLRMEKVGDGVEYEIETKDGEREVIHVEKALLSIGRIPNTEGLNLEAAGVEMSKRGVHIGDTDTQTNIPNIYAVGDVSGHIQLVNVGEREARHAVVKMFADFPVRPINYENVSTIMFLDPVVAAVGKNEKQLREDGTPYRMAKVGYGTIARAIAMRKTRGFFKLIVSDDDDMKVLGMRAVGEHAGSCIQSVALLMYMGKGIDELAHMIHPHPAIVEGVQECARMLLGKSIYKSAVFKDNLACYRWDGKNVIPIHVIEEKNIKSQEIARKFHAYKED